jgi:hypothetical protein
MANYKQSRDPSARPCRRILVPADARLPAAAIYKQTRDPSARRHHRLPAAAAFTGNAATRAPDAAAVHQPTPDAAAV